MKLSVSFLKSKNSKEDTIKAIAKTNCNYLHVDIMDGVFVTDKTEDLTRYLKNIPKKLDVHLMVQDPLIYLNDYIDLPVEYFTFHLEIKKDLLNIINKIKEKNFKVGIAINPDTSINELNSYLPIIDQILVMGVYPGKGGQKFIPTILSKIKQLRLLKQENNYKYLISVDGGVNAESAQLIKEAGADMIVSGSYITMSDDYQSKINKLKSV